MDVFLTKDTIQNVLEKLEIEQQKEFFEASNKETKILIKQLYSEKNFSLKEIKYIFIKCINNLLDNLKDEDILMAMQDNFFDFTKFGFSEEYLNILEQRKIKDFYKQFYPTKSSENINKSYQEVVQESFISPYAKETLIDYYYNEILDIDNKLLRNIILNFSLDEVYEFTVSFQTFLNDFGKLNKEYSDIIYNFRICLRRKLRIINKIFNVWVPEIFI